MVEQTKKELDKEERTKDIEVQKELLKKTQEETARLNEAIAKREEQKAEDLVSGSSDAGTAPEPKEKDEDRVKREVNEFLEPTGMSI